LPEGEQVAEDNNQQGTENQEEAAVQKKSDAVSKNPSGGVNPKIIIAALVINVLALVAVAFFVYQKNSERASEPTLSDIKKESDSDQASGSASTTPEVTNYIKESFTVNLADADTQHFALVDIAIEVTNTFVKDEIERSRPRIRDFIVVLLSSKTLDEVSTADGREFLREEIRNKVNGYLTKGEVKSVLFEKFIIQ
jgi:flagellar protein FliL